MDPLSQGVVGAIVPQSFAQKNTLFWATVIGFLSGLAPDLDIFIRSDIDPLLFLEYHRQFTHSLIFIPIGGFICAYLFFILIRNKLNFHSNKFGFSQPWDMVRMDYWMLARAMEPYFFGLLMIIVLLGITSQLLIRYLLFQYLF